MKKFSLIFVFLILLISCSKIQEKKKTQIKNNYRFRMKAFTWEEVPQFDSLSSYRENPNFERKDKKIRADTFSCEIDGEGDGVSNAVYMKTNFIFTTGGYNGRIKITKKFDSIIQNNKIKFIKISEWKQTKQEKQIESIFFEQLERKKFLTYFQNIADEKIANLIPEGVAIRFYKKLDFNRDGKPDYFVIFSYPIYYDDAGLNEQVMLYIILSQKEGYSLQLKSWMGESRFRSIVDVKVYKNKYLFISQIITNRTGGDGEFELYWYE